MTTDTCFWIFQRESFEPADPLCTWAPPTDSLHFSSARARVKTSSTWRFVAPMSHGCCSPCRKFHVSSPDPRFSHHRLIKEPNKSDDDTSMVLLLMMLRFNLILALNLIYIGRYVEIPSSWMQSYWLEWHWSKSGTIVANETRPGDWIQSFEIDLSSTYPLPLLLLHLLFLQAPLFPTSRPPTWEGIYSTPTRRRLLPSCMWITRNRLFPATCFFCCDHPETRRPTQHKWISLKWINFYLCVFKKRILPDCVWFSVNRNELSSQNGEDSLLNQPRRKSQAAVLIAVNDPSANFPIYQRFAQVWWIDWRFILDGSIHVGSI